MPLKDKIISDMTAAMKAKDAARTSTLRMVKAAIMHREKEGAGELQDDDVLKLLRSQLKQRRDSVDQYQKAGRQDLADKEAVELGLIQTYLPEQLGEDELNKIIDGAISEAGATDMKDMGKVVGIVSKQTAGKADGGQLAKLVRKKLQG